MSTMKAARIHEWGNPRSLYVADAPIPEPKPDQILVRVRGSSANPIDYGVAQSYLRYFRVPFTFGFDLAGDVAAVGSKVSGIAVGDAVYGEPPSGGGFAQYAVINANKVARKPASLSYEESGVVPAVAQTAWQALFTKGGLTAGQKVLIHAAAGGVGHMAVQLAKAHGAYVIGTASAANEAFVRELGADEFIDYRKTRFEEVVQDADLVVATVRNDTVERSYAAVKSGGMVVTVVGEAMQGAARQRGVRTASVLVEYSLSDELEAITRLIDAGKVKPHVSASYPLDQFQEALKGIGSGHTRGKIAVAIP